MFTASGKHACLLLALGIFGVCASQAGSSSEPAPSFSWGADEQFRPLEHHSRNIWFDPDHAASNDGPPVDCIRWRERIWFDSTPLEHVSLFVRVSHRWWHFYSRPGPNDQKRTTWRFPDEVVFDALQLKLSPPGDSGWTFSLGRQDLWEKSKAVFGTGMILNDGTTNDGGRTSYFDGALASWRGSDHKDLLRVGAFHLGWKDRFLVINDVQRQLRPGNTDILALDWTHTLGQSASVESYLYKVKVEDPFQNRQKTDILVSGLRLFGKASEQFDYSVELAHQSGKYQGGIAGGPLQDCSGNMVDARVALKLPSLQPRSAMLKLQYTYFSGDTPSTPGRYEGWNPLLATNVPLFREECYYTLNKGLWTDLHHLTLSLETTLRPGDPARNGSGKLSLTPGWTSLYTERDTNGGKGRHVGEMGTLFFDWQCTSHLKLSLLGAMLLSGNHYSQRNFGEWLRCELLFTY